MTGLICRCALTGSRRDPSSRWVTGELSPPPSTEQRAALNSSAELCPPEKGVHPGEINCSPFHPCSTNWLSQSWLDHICTSCVFVRQPEETVPESWYDALGTFPRLNASDAMPRTPLLCIPHAVCLPVNVKVPGAAILFILRMAMTNI